ncbi:MAG: chorismate synthase [Bacteroidota bacterium]
MSGNSFGQIFRITSYGESHGKGIGVVIDGCPAGLILDESLIQNALASRKPGQSSITSSRAESDSYTIQSGISNGITTGAPIAFFVPNIDAKSNDYDALQQAYRPSHADYTYDMKYGIRDIAGGGRSSARETIARVIGGAVAQMLLAHYKIEIVAYVSQIGTITCTKNYETLDLKMVNTSLVRCPDHTISEQMIAAIEEAKKEGDSLGGVITCIAKQVPVGLGEPVYDRLEADLAKAMLSINATKGFEIGSGFAGTKMKGSEHNDIFYKEGEQIKTKTNYSGGVQGGISNGMDIYFNVAFKPTSTIFKEQETIDIAGNPLLMQMKGRHDPCVVPRAVPIVEAMTALVLADHILRNRSARI